MTWRGATAFFFMTVTLVAFPSATQLPWSIMAEARPIPQRLPISPERLSLAGSGEAAVSEEASEEKDKRRLGP